MENYKLTNHNSIIRLSDAASIPLAEENSDYKSYLTWVAEGNIPEPADPIITPPIVVSAWQIRKALNQLKLRNQVETAVAASDQNLKDAWEYAASVERDHPLVAQMGIALNKTAAEMEALFKLAKNL